MPPPRTVGALGCRSLSIAPRQQRFFVPGGAPPNAMEGSKTGAAIGRSVSICVLSQRRLQVSNVLCAELAHPLSEGIGRLADAVDGTGR